MHGDDGDVTPDDTQYAKWLDNYTDLLVAELDSRDCDIDREVASDFIETTISMIANTTGTSEREARLSITETAVPAWATMLIDSNDDAELEFVAISGVHFAGLQTWVNSVLPLMETIDSGGLVPAPIDVAMQIAEIVGVVEAGFIVDEGFENALEMAVPDDMVHTVIAALIVVGEWLTSTDLEEALRDIPDQLELPEDLAEIAEESGALAGLCGQLAHLGERLADAIGRFHHHIDEPDEVLRYDDIDE